MQPDLKGLEITDEELKELTSLEINSREKLKFTPFTVFIITFLLVLIWGMVFFMVFKFWGIINLILSGIATLATIGEIYKKRNIKLPKQIVGLLKEVENYNQIIKDIDTLDQLRAVGNQISLNNREKVIQALKITREDLVRALNTERILRKNPKFNADKFVSQLTALRALQISEQAGEYGRLMNEALQIEMSL